MMEKITLDNVDFLDLSIVKDALKENKLRGKIYGRAMKRLWMAIGDKLVSEASATPGHLSPLDVAKIAVINDLQLKHTFVFLEWSGILHSGKNDYATMQRKGLRKYKVADILNQAREALNKSQESID